ncbi:MAG: radical SAM protein [Elusimicrobiales bacterium]|nr:radical SAM protein [Elusimicrobiales bacterium]
MKILLVKPGIAHGDHIQPPLGIAFLAARLRDANEVRVLDFGMLGRDDAKFLAAVKDFSPDIVGFQCYSPELGEVKRLAALTRAALPKAVIVSGGPHPTLCPEETMAKLSPEADYLLRGETEDSFPLFIKLLAGQAAPADVPGLAWRENGALRVNEISPIKDIDALPPPAWDLIGPQNYPPAQHGAFFNQFPIAPIVTTRGCPFACGFCTAPILSGKRMRKRGAASVMAEIELLYHKFGIREIHIVDDNFTLDKAHAVGILKAIIASGLPISLAFPNGVRIGTLDEELLDLMKRAGTYLISVGIESGSDKTLKRMDKQLSVALIREKVALIRRMKIDLAAFFILGFPDETVEDMRETISFSLELPLLRANFFTFLPLPMTPVTLKLIQSGEIGQMDVEGLIFQKVPYAPKGVTREQLRSLQREAFLKFYLRPGVMVRNVLQIRSLKHFGYLVKRFYHWILM